MPSVSRRAQAIIAGAVVVAVLAALVGFLLSDRTPPLTREILQRQRRLWKEQDIDSYNLRLRVDVGAAGEKIYSLDVRDGEVAGFAIDGKTLAGGEAYTIDGLFDMMQRELELGEDPSRGGPGAPKNSILRAEFDPGRHYPARFVRLASDNRNVFIHVESLTVKREGEGSP